MLIDDIEKFKTDLNALTEFNNVYINNSRTIFDENTATIFLGNKQLIDTMNKGVYYEIEILIVYAFKGDLKNTAIYRNAELLEDKINDLIYQDFNGVIENSIKITEVAEEAKGKLIILHDFRINYMKGD